MITPRNFQNQQGVALFLSLIMLLVLTVLGVSSFHNSHIQERSAGNSRLQSVAFEAAAAGASNAINFFDANRDLGADQLCGALEHEGWENASEWVDMGSMGEASLKQRIYCLADEYPDAGGGRPARSQLFVLSRGEVTSGGNVVAQRDVEVRLDLGHAEGGGGGCGALCFPTCEGGSYDFPSSNSFQVDGGGGYAVTGGCDSEADLIEEGIWDSRIGNYEGGVGAISPGSPWNDPALVEAFREHIMLTAQSAQENGNCLSDCYSPGDVDQNGSAQYGTTDLPQFTYIHGNASMGGDVSGAGIMMVHGNLSWMGTPQFEGLIVVLGGSFEIAAGGGGGGDHAGSVVTLNAPGDGSFYESSFGTIGGGTAEFNYDCETLQMSYALLESTGGGDLWSPECDAGPQTPYEAGPTDLIIASWRENIGWREDFFGAEGG